MYRTMLRRVLLVALLCCAPAIAAAQGFIYHYDSTFHIGAHLARHPEVEKTELHFDFGNFYNQPNLGLDTRVVRDSTLWPFTADANALYEWRIDRDLYSRADTLGYDLVFSPSIISRIGESSYAIENFYGRVTDTVNLASFAVQTPDGDHDELKSAYVYGVIVPATTPPSDLMVAGQSRYTYRAMKPSDPALYTSVGLSDQSRYFDLTFTVKADETILNQDTIPGSALIGYGELWIRDTTGQSGPGACHCNFYTKVDSFPVTKAKYLGSDSAGNGYLDVTFTFDFRDSSGNWKWAPRYDFGPGAGTGDSSLCGLACGALLDTLRARHLISDATRDIPHTVEGGDVWYAFHSTREVPVTFLKGRIGPHLLAVLRKDSLDTLIDAAVDAIYADSLLARRMLRVGIQDEPNWERFAAYRTLDSKVQRRMGSHGSSGPSGLWCDPYQDYATVRAATGDFDSTQVKMIQQMAVQPYIINQTRLPVFYADPDSMGGSAALFSFYRTHDDSTGSRIIAFNDSADRDAYDASVLGIMAYKGASYADAIQTARHRFSHLPNARPYPVWPVVESHGFYDGASYRRIPTPQEITAQAWCALGLHPDGLMFSDFEYDYVNLGLVHKTTGAHDSEYAALYDPSPTVSTLRYPMMWFGMRSRFEAVKSVTDEFQTIKSVYTKLDYDPRFWFTHLDTSGALMRAVLDTLYARHAQPYDTAMDGGFLDDAATDTLSRMRLAVSWFKPGPALPAEAAEGVRYLMVTNLLCWPVDRRIYGDTARSYGSSFGQRDTGLGAVDVRRPVVRFRNIGMMADSIRVERVGHETEWSRTVALADTVQLDWLPPGQGMLYRIVPAARGLSPLGTAFNNAVHAENPSTDTVQRDRIVVYERDSIVYMRVADSAGFWSREWMISDTADTARTVVGGVARRQAENIRPAVASTRDGAYAMIVWERRTPGNYSTVELCWFDSLPTRRGLPDTVRRTLTASCSFSDHPALGMAPAIVGLDSGFVVAWGLPANGVGVIAVSRTPIDGDQSLDGNDTSFSVRVKMSSPILNAGTLTGIDSVCQLPTLAWNRQWTRTCVNCGVSSALGLLPNPFEGIMVTSPPIYHGFNVHLAYQQGPADGSGHNIMYNMLEATFPDGLPQLSASPTERVTRDLVGCDFIAPSIAVDSTRIGVAFQINDRDDRSVALRFRDSLNKYGIALQPWKTVTYRWGGSIQTKLGYGSALNYELPSLVQFPSASKSQLESRAEGGLVWHWTNPSAGRRNRQLVYRYNWTQPDTSLPDGEFPSMMLVPDRSTSLFASTGVLHRADTTQRMTLPRQLSGTALFYPGYLENTPSTPVRFFQTSPNGRGIYGNYKLILSHYSDPECASRARIEHALVMLSVADADGYPTDISGVPGLPPAFFATPVAGVTNVDSLEAASGVARTGIFAAGGAPVSVRRVIVGSTDLVDALDLAPVDSVTHDSANVMLFMELVCAGDSVVLWRGDSIDARTVGSQGYDDQVSVPVDTATGPGTPVFVRLRATPTRGLEYDLEAGFEFMEDSTDGGLSKMTRSTGAARRADGSARMSLMVVPNPVRTTAEIRVRLPEPGMLELAVYDMLGRRVVAPDPLRIDRPGISSTVIDLGGLPDGSYTVVARMQGHGVAGHLSVVR